MVQRTTECHFVDDAKKPSLDINFTIKKLANDTWQVNGHATYANGGDRLERKFTRTLETNESMWIGSWEAPFAKKDVSENLYDAIPCDNLPKKLQNQTLIKLSSYGNTVSLTSDYLTLLPEQVDDEAAVTHSPKKKPEKAPS